MANKTLLGVLVLTGLAIVPVQAQSERTTPYWASITAGKALMRTGPGRNYPATWLYLRPDLPIRVVETYPNWRKVQDPEGATGWMLQRLLADTRTGLVTGKEPRAMHEEPNEASPVRYLAEPGVVGRISRCGAGWCRFDVAGRQGHIRIEHLWGIEPGATVD